MGFRDWDFGFIYSYLIFFILYLWKGAAGKSLKVGAEDKTQAIMTAMKSRMMEVERKHFKMFDLIR